jgi:hypothetical protein
MPNTQIHNRSLSWLGTDTSVKSDGAIVVLLAQNLSTCKAQKKRILKIASNCVAVFAK